jgi:hypothetical protein
LGLAAHRQLWQRTLTAGRQAHLLVNLIMIGVAVADRLAAARPTRDMYWTSR